MPAELVLYTNPMSRGRTARWMLEEVGAPYRAEVLDFGDAMKGDYLRINRMGKVPSLVHGEVVVTETAAICLYLADVFPDAKLAPTVGSPERGAYYRWMLFAAGPLEAVITNRALQIEPTEQQKKMVGYGDYATTLAALESHLSQTHYAAGSAFTATDVYLGSQLAWGMEFGMIERRPAFEAYRDRLKDRPASSRATQLDDELIAAAQPN
ncbi:glutathione S-transferase family protein [Aureimonas psammosilenae]|uniref:glutathione S-transferase family protein n=1 Tax=Aureimonas psammosilenae TaxID=2495496 RepID=UPI00126090A8|nr:glutathione S-transferase family protein [Aureimonas psammosilenae]